MHGSTRDAANQSSSPVPQRSGVWLGLAAITLAVQTAPILTSDEFCEDYGGNWEGQRTDMLLYNGPAYILKPWCLAICMAVLLDHRGRWDSSSAVHLWAWRYTLFAWPASFGNCARIGAYCNALDSTPRTFYQVMHLFVLGSIGSLGGICFMCVALMVLRVLAKSNPRCVMTGYCCFVANVILILSRMGVYFGFPLSSPESWPDLHAAYMRLTVMIQVAWNSFFMCVILALFFTARTALSVAEAPSHATTPSIPIAAARTRQIAWVIVCCTVITLLDSVASTHVSNVLLETNKWQLVSLIRSVCDVLVALAELMILVALVWTWSPISPSIASIEHVLEVAAKATVVREVNVQKLCGEMISPGELDQWRQMFEGTIGEAVTMEKYTAVTDDYSHYRLGISLEGMVLVLQRIGLIFHCNGTGSPGFEYIYCGSMVYERGQDDKWLDNVCGAITDGGVHGRLNVTGYDVCIYIRRWLVSSGFGALSLVEVVLTHPQWSDLRKHVGFASCLWSHLQSEPLLGPCSTLSTIARYLAIASSDHTIFFWCDYLCLRQAWPNAFKTECVVEAIRWHGGVVACIDAEMSYLRRSFCLLEVFAAFIGGCRMQCITSATEDDLEKTPVDTKSAQTRFSADKVQIDGFVEKTIGFHRLDVLLTSAILQGLAADGEVIGAE